MTTRSSFKIEDPSRGPGRVDFTAPDEGFGLEGTPEPKIQRGPFRPQRKPYKQIFKKHFRLCGNLEWGHANLSLFRSIFHGKVAPVPEWFRKEAAAKELYPAVKELQR